MAKQMTNNTVGMPAPGLAGPAAMAMVHNVISLQPGKAKKRTKKKIAA
jgi:hypothetical protein